MKIKGMRGDPDDPQQRFDQRRQRHERKKLGTRSAQSLILAAEDPQQQEAVRFDDPGLQVLYERGKLEEILWRHQQGKEATVYVGRGPLGLVAAKIYTDIRLRSFRNDRVYRDGRYISHQRTERAIEARTQFGISAQQALWIEEEFKQLQQLHAAGLPVPRPIDRAGAVVLMEFLGSEEGAAPRLAEAHLEGHEVQQAFQQSVQILASLVRLGKAHGDFSTFNLLWWQERVWAIDFPQVVEMEHNPQGEVLLRRDIEGLCRTFSPLGLKARPDQVLAQVLRLAQASG